MMARDPFEAHEPTLRRYHAAAQQMGLVFQGLSRFVVDALDWLSERYDQVRLEYSSKRGWVLMLGEDSGVAIRGDGSIESALRTAIERETLDES